MWVQLSCLVEALWPPCCLVVPSPLGACWLKKVSSCPWQSLPGRPEQSHAFDTWLHQNVKLSGIQFWHHAMWVFFLWVFFFFAWTSVAALISNFTIWNAQGICVIFKLQNTLQTWDWHDLQISASASFSFSSVSHMLFFFFFWWVHKRCLDRNRKASKLLSCLSVLQSWLQP